MKQVCFFLNINFKYNTRLRIDKTRSAKLFRNIPPAPDQLLNIYLKRKKEERKKKTFASSMQLVLATIQRFRVPFSHALLITQNNTYDERLEKQFELNIFFLCVCYFFFFIFSFFFCFKFKIDVRPMCNGSTSKTETWSNKGQRTSR